MRTVDADHMKSRIIITGNPSEDIIAESLIKFIDSEETISDGKSEIMWVKSKRERRTKDCHAISNGVECNRCHCFEIYPRRFCPDCGGRFNGELPVKNNYAERNVRRFNKWQK